MTDDEYGAPHDPHAELAVLASCYASPVAAEKAGKSLSGADFFSPHNQLIYEAINDLRRAGKPVDHVTLGDALRSIDVPQSRDSALRLLPELVTHPSVPEEVEHHAGIVRSCAVRRRIINVTAEYRQRAYSPAAPTSGLLDEMVRDVSALRELNAPDIETMLLGEIMAEQDDPYDWVIPGLLERMDRMVLTGIEGLGKSTFLRQIAVFAAAGMHPFKPNRSVPPIRVHVFECENTKRHTKRQLRAMFAKAKQIGDDPSDRVFFDFRPQGMDLLRDKDASWLHRALDATQPDLVVIGPLYKLFPRAIQTDDEAAPAIAALDAIRNRGHALIVEAHSGHSKGASGKRDVRPRGSSALLGWPEFGYGLRWHSDRDAAARGAAELVPWRGDRDERQWPRELGRGGIFPWAELNHNPYRPEAAA